MSLSVSGFLPLSWCLFFRSAAWLFVVLVVAWFHGGFEFHGEGAHLPSFLFCAMWERIRAVRFLCDAFRCSVTHLKKTLEPKELLAARRFETITARNAKREPHKNKMNTIDGTQKSSVVRGTGQYIRRATRKKGNEENEKSVHQLGPWLSTDLTNLETNET